MATLSANDLVYSTVNSGLMADPPLFGVVDLIDGVGDDLVRVNWENGATQFFDTTTDTACQLQIWTVDGSASDYVGKPVTYSAKGVKQAIILRTMMLGASRYALIKIYNAHVKRNKDGEQYVGLTPLYAIVLESSLTA